MDRLAIVRECFRAYERGDRALIEPHLAADYVFSAPPDVGLDRATYFERCWANAGHIARIDIVREIEHGDEVVVTYELTRTDGGRGRNTEIHTFRGEQLVETEVYFGWDLS